MPSKFKSIILTFHLDTVVKRHGSYFTQVFFVAGGVLLDKFF